MSQTSSFAEANRTSFYLSEETLWDENPTGPSMVEIQLTSDSGGHKKTTAIPVTIRPDRQVEDIIRVGEHAEFMFNFELRAVQFDNLLAAFVGAENAGTFNNGVALRSFLLEKRYNDVSIFEPYRGMRPNVLTLNIDSQRIITGSMSFLGARGLPAGSSVAGSTTAAESHPALDASNNVLTIKEGGSTLTTPVFRGTLNINGNAAIQPAVAHRFPVGVRYGKLLVSGSIEVYFDTVTLKNKFINHNNTSLEFQIQDGAGHGYDITIPRVFFTDGDNNTTGENTDVFVTLNWHASVDPVTGYQIRIATS